jgi:hypothetical protein
MTRNRLCCWLAIALSCGATGCLFGRFGQRDPYALNAPCTLPSNLSLSELVAHLNRNTERMTSWRCMNVAISSRGPLGLPVKLSAMLAVEQPRNFRLLASLGANNEVDLGSNDERFWFWISRFKPPGVYTARHDQMDVALRRFPIPFQPDWLVEALGVVPLDESEFTMQPHETDPRLVNLIRYRPAPQGDPVRLVMVVDICHGLIVEHRLHSPSGQLVARAGLKNYLRDGVTGAVLPHLIELDWPQEKLGLTLELGAIEVNHGPLATQTFALPEIGNAPLRDLGAETPPGTAHVFEPIAPPSAGRVDTPRRRARRDRLAPFENRQELDVE